MGPYQWVSGRISVGGALTAANLPELIADGITHICDVTQHDDDAFLVAAQAHPDVKVLWLNTADDGASKVEVFEQIPPWFFALWGPRVRLNFHCDGGCNRGPSACYLALRLLDWPAQQAEQAIRSARPEVGAGCLRYRLDAEQVASHWGAQ